MSSLCVDLEPWRNLPSSFLFILPTGVELQFRRFVIVNPGALSRVNSLLRSRQGVKRCRYSGVCCGYDAVFEESGVFAGSSFQVVVSPARIRFRWSSGYRMSLPCGPVVGVWNGAAIFGLAYFSCCGRRPPRQLRRVPDFPCLFLNGLLVSCHLVESWSLSPLLPPPSPPHLDDGTACKKEKKKKEKIRNQSQKYIPIIQLSELLSVSLLDRLLWSRLWRFLLQSIYLIYGKAIDAALNYWYHFFSLFCQLQDRSSSCLSLRCNDLAASLLPKTAFRLSAFPAWCKMEHRLGGVDAKYIPDETEAKDD